MFEEILKRINSLNMTKREEAEALGVSRQIIHYWRTGRYKMSFDVYEKIDSKLKELGK